MRNKLAIAALMCGLAGPAHAHCYSRWFYPWPQHCGAHPVRIAAVMREVAPLPPIKDIGIPLPDLAFQACGEPDEHTAGLLLLRAKLEDPAKGEDAWQKIVTGR